ncbi:zinc finger, CCHC-type containing protein [Tanacetum coccineum]
MHFLLTTLKVVYVLSTPMPEFVEDETLEQTRKRCKWENDDYICRGHILNGMSDALFDVYQNVGLAKELWDQLESKYMAENAFIKKFLFKTEQGELSLVQLVSYFRIEETLRAEESGKGKGQEIEGSSSVNMIEDGKNKNNNKNNKAKKSKYDGNNDGSNKKSKLTCWKCGKTRHFKKDCNVKKNNDGNMSSSGQGSKDPNSSQVPNAFSSVSMISSKDVDYSMWHARLGHVHYKRMLAMSKDNLIPEFDITLGICNTCMLNKITRQPFRDIKRDSNVLELIHSDLCDFHATLSLGNKKYVVTFIDDASIFCYVYLCHDKDEALDKFKIYKTEVELQQNDLIKTLRTDRGGEYYDPVYFQSVGIIHETTAPYTPQQNGVSERKNKALKEMVNSMLSYSGLSEGFWGEAIYACSNSLLLIPLCCDDIHDVTPRVSALAGCDRFGIRALVIKILGGRA